jgi:hypothetical protein
MVYDDEVHGARGAALNGILQRSTTADYRRTSPFSI